MRTALHPICTLIVAGLVALNTSARGDVFIDSFADAQSAPGGTDSRTTADGAGILGGERDLISFLTVSINGTVPNQAYIAFPSGVGLNPPAGASFVYDGNDNDPSSGFFGGLGAVDLTQGGLNNGFRFYLSSVVSGGSPINLWITVRNVNEGSTAQLPLPMTAGVWDVPFSLLQKGDFMSSPANFAHVGYIEILFGMTTGQSLVLDQFTTTTVPEPSAFSLLTLGSAASVFFRRIRR